MYHFPNGIYITCNDDAPHKTSINMPEIIRDTCEYINYFFKTLIRTTNI